jgi:outer membrane beta-barrel protein
MATLSRPTFSGIKKLIFSFAILQLAVIFTVPARAEVIQFPEDELAAESVLPIFDQPDAVKSRMVQTKNRVELGVSGGYSLTEAFFNPVSMGLNATYHFNEEHGFNFYYDYFFGGQSDYGKQLNPIPNTTPAINANLQYAPSPKFLALANYQYTGYYGKLSLSKETVMNLGLYGLGGLGVIAIGDATKPVASIGLGQKFYFDSRFALRFDLRFLAYRGPDALSRALDKKTTEQTASYFDEKTVFESLLTFGAVYLFPAF